MLWLSLQKHDCVPKFILLSDAARHGSGINDHGVSVRVEQHGGREGNVLILCQSGKKTLLISASKSISLLKHEGCYCFPHSFLI